MKFIPLHMKLFSIFCAFKDICCRCLVIIANPWGVAFPWDFLGKNIGVGWYFLLQGIFPTHGSNWISPALEADSLLW